MTPPSKAHSRLSTSCAVVMSRQGVLDRKAASSLAPSTWRQRPDISAPPAAFDLITTFDAVHAQARPLGLLVGVRRALRPDGVYLMQDIRAASALHDNLEHPLRPLFYSISTMHCMSVSLAQGGEGLGTMWGRERAQALLAEAGFAQVTLHELPHDIQNDYYVVRSAPGSAGSVRCL